MNITAFRTGFPEFKGVSDSLVQDKLDASMLEIDTSVWKNKSDQGQAYLTAHKLATSPFGQSARMVVASKQGYDCTTYGQTFKSLMRQVTSGFRITS